MRKLISFLFWCSLVIFILYGCWTIIITGLNEEAGMYERYEQEARANAAEYAPEPFPSPEPTPTGDESNGS